MPFLSDCHPCTTRYASNRDKWIAPPRDKAFASTRVLSHTVRPLNRSLLANFTFQKVNSTSLCTPRTKFLINRPQNIVVYNSFVVSHHFSDLQGPAGFPSGPFTVFSQGKSVKYRLDPSRFYRRFALLAKISDEQTVKNEEIEWSRQYDEASKHDELASFWHSGK